jgi:hypothetical protein
MVTALLLHCNIVFRSARGGCGVIPPLTAFLGVAVSLVGILEMAEGGGTPVWPRQDASI